MDCFSDVDTLRAQLFLFKSKNIKKPLKEFLLDYKYICGIGNIYASEICFDAKLSPLKSFNTLSDQDLKTLSKSINLVIHRAYEAGGSSIEDFKHLDGTQGHAQDFHKVYHKEVCPVCGSKIICVKQASRSTFYCPTCQEVDQ